MKKPVPHILIVEDDKALREVLLLALRFEGYSVRTAEDGKKALECLAARVEKPGLIISDLHMPVMDGMTLLQHVRSDTTNNLQNIPFLMMSAAPLEEVPVGVDRFLSKPICLSELLLFVARCCGPGRPLC